MTRKDRFVTTPNRDLPEFSPADLDRLAQVDQLLVAMDFDGTLAEFSDSPTDVRAVPGAIEALQDLAACPGVLVVLISGRHLTQLSDVSGLPILANPGDGDVRLVGSHGAQPADQLGLVRGMRLAPSGQQRRRLRRSEHVQRQHRATESKPVAAGDLSRVRRRL